VSDNPDNLIADLTAPGVVVAYYLSDGSTATRPGLLRTWRQRCLLLSERGS
jgi:hypothetical protein